MRPIMLSPLHLPLAAICALCLAGCTPVPAPATSAPNLAANASFYSGTVVAIRHADTGADSTGSVAQIMSTLGQQPASSQSGALEIVIRLADGSVRTFAQPALPGLASLTPGKHVAITEAANTVIRQE
jgi:outer membrane lipoprotein SlyB